MIIKTDSNHRVLHSCFALFLAFIALFISGQAQAKTYTYIVGNKIPDTNKYGPTTDVVWAKPRQMGKTVAYHDESALREIVVYDWGSNDTNEGGGYAFCNSTNNNDTPLTIRRGFGTPAGKTPDGHDMWKTNVEGLYFAFEIYSLYTAWSTLNTSLPIWLDQTDTPIHFTPTDSLKTACNNTIINTYAVAGGSVFPCVSICMSMVISNPTEAATLRMSISSMWMDTTLCFITRQRPWMRVIELSLVLTRRVLMLSGQAVPPAR